MDLSSDLDHDKDYVSVVRPGVRSDLTLRSTTDSSISPMDLPT